MLNYAHYFTEIEQRFTERRGSILLLSTLDWALIETWREADVPLEAVLRGIDDAFDKYEQRAARAKGRLRKVNGLAWCAQSVMAAAEAKVDAATGLPREKSSTAEASGLEAERIAAHLSRNAAQLRSSTQAGEAVGEIAARLEELAAQVPADTEALEQELSVLEERLFAAVTLAAPADELLTLREQAARELAPHRAKMAAAQIRQITDQFVQKRLLQARGLPRLSLFYMEMA